MTKFKLLFNKDEMEKWVNEMVAQGYALKRTVVGMCTFEECAPNEYEYRIDFAKGFFKVTNKYRKFMEEKKVEIVDVWGPWVYLRKKVADGPIHVYTEVGSTITHYEQLKMLFKLVTGVEIFCLLLELLGLMGGNTQGLPSVCLIAAFVGVLIREIMRINDILFELKTRVGQDVGRLAKRGNGQYTGCLILGLLLNAVGFALQSPELLWLKVICHSLSIILFTLVIILRFPRKKP